MKTILVDAINGLVIEDKGEFKVFIDMQNLLDSYPNPKIILTNANDEEIKKFNLDKVPYPLFTLKHEPYKHDHEYYMLMLAKFDLEAEDVIYFEHNEDAVKSAQSVGIATYHYDHTKKDLRKLMEFIDNNI